MESKGRTQGQQITDRKRNVRERARQPRAGAPQRMRTSGPRPRRASPRPPRPAHAQRRCRGGFRAPGERPRPLCCRRHHGTCGHAPLRWPRGPSALPPLPARRPGVPTRASLRRHPRRRWGAAPASPALGRGRAPRAVRARAGPGSERSGAVAPLLKRRGFVQFESFPGAEGNLEERWGRTVHRSMW